MYVMLWGVLRSRVVLLSLMFYAVDEKTLLYSQPSNKNVMCKRCVSILKNKYVQRNSNNIQFETGIMDSKGPKVYMFLV